MTGVIGGVSVDADRMYAALESGFSQATDLAAPTVTVICDNATIHHSGVTTRLLAAHPRLLLVEGARYCPRDNPIRQLVRLAKIRWRVEHEDREMKHGLGLDHYQGRAWHHYLPLVTAAHAFCTLRCLDPKAQTPAWPSAKSSPPSRSCSGAGPAHAPPATAIYQRKHHHNSTHPERPDEVLPRGCTT